MILKKDESLNDYKNMALFLDEQTLKDLGFFVTRSEYDTNKELVLLMVEQTSETYPVIFYYIYDKNRCHMFSLYHEDGSCIVESIETMDQFLKLASALKF